MSNLTATKMVVALALCLLLLGGFSVEAAGRVNDNCHYSGQCIGDIDCTEHCRSQGYSRGSCKIRVINPSSKVDLEVIDVDYNQPGDCCCLH
ncbi:hypothetical protein MKX01_018180 [Papaver californicum]|nr:hypothetical protein MKX01_018180 [Papaver californicum]